MYRYYNTYKVGFDNRCVRQNSKGKTRTCVQKYVRREAEESATYTYINTCMNKGF